jgi:pyrimidine deaminase RibD-like protein
VDSVFIHDDAYFMSIAIQLARLCKSESSAKEPKPLVGAVLVENMVILGKAFRGELSPGEHAEFTLLQKKLPENTHRAAGTTLYTTLEPCTTRGPGKTPCVDHILGRKIQRVVIGILDPNHKIRGEGIWLLRERGVDVSLCSSLQMAEIEEVCAKFVAHHRPRVPRRPWYRRLLRA